jgi:hypothetical protein
MAPPQSYLDIQNHHFSRFVNLTDHRGFHDDFSYFGANAYAYLLEKFGEFIDLIPVQFYESYSRASQAVNQRGFSPSAYLIWYVETLLLNNETFFVDFSDDPESGLSSVNVILPLSKLVLGFGNGWAGNEKSLFFPTEEVQIAWMSLIKRKMQPRGFMFWTIDQEGENGVVLAPDLHRILST